MADIWMDVDAALSEVPVNLLSLIDDTDFKTREESVVFNQSGLDLLWNFITTAGAFTQTAVTPTDTAGDYDWVNQGNGHYTIEIPASGGASINNDTEGFGYFSGFATGILPWRGPVIGFRAAGINNLLIDSASSATRGLAGTALPDAVADAAGGLPISDAGGLDLDTQLAATNEVTAARMGALTDWINGGRLDLILDIIAADTTTDIPALIATLQADLDIITGAAGALLDTTATSPQLVDDVMDEVLTGGTHNVVDSLGRRIRDLQEFGVYEGGAIWIDTVNGTAGTTDFESGTAFNPVDTIADANTLAASLGLSKFHVASGSTITFAATQTNQVFEGENWTLALGGQSIIGTTIIGAQVSGVASGVGTKQIFKDCILDAVSHVKNTHALNCGLDGTQTIVEAGDFFFDQCHSAMAGTGTVTFDFGAALAASDLHVRHHSGGWTIENMGAGAGTYNASFEGDGQIIWAASCSATSNASIRGNWKITDNAGGAVTETLDDNQTSVDAILVDTGTDIPATLGTPTDTDLATDIANVQTGVDAIPTTAMRGTDSAALASVCTEVRLAELDAANLPAGVDSAVALFTTQLTEAYAADGVAPTPAQALFLIQQMLTEFAIAGTTNTVKKLDGSTTAATMTLDDATNPTSSTRAT